MSIVDSVRLRVIEDPTDPEPRAVFYDACIDHDEPIDANAMLLLRGDDVDHLLDCQRTEVLQALQTVFCPEAAGFIVPHEWFSEGMQPQVLVLHNTQATLQETEAALQELEELPVDSRDPYAVAFLQSLQQALRFKRTQLVLMSLRTASQGKANPDYQMQREFYAVRRQITTLLSERCRTVVFQTLEEIQNAFAVPRIQILHAEVEKLLEESENQQPNGEYENFENLDRMWRRIRNAEQLIGDLQSLHGSTERQMHRTLKIRVVKLEASNLRSKARTMQEAEYPNREEIGALVEELDKLSARIEEEELPLKNTSRVLQRLSTQLARIIRRKKR